MSARLLKDPEDVKAKLEKYKNEESTPTIATLMLHLGIKHRKTFMEYLNRDDEIGDLLKDEYLRTVSFWEKELRSRYTTASIFYLKTLRSLGFNYARENDVNWSDDEDNTYDIEEEIVEPS